MVFLHDFFNCPHYFVIWFIFKWEASLSIINSLRWGGAIWGRGRGKKLGADPGLFTRWWGVIRGRERDMQKKREEELALSLKLTGAVKWGKWGN